MSTQKPILSAVFTTLGFLGFVTADPVASRASGPSDSVGTTTPDRLSETSPSAPKDEIILLTDGTVVHGSVTYDELGCLIQTPFGSKRFPKTRIDRSFSSLREVYDYKASQFPDEDSEERLKLAQWCLSQKLNDEAKSQLHGVLKLSPTHPRAKAMLEKIQQAEAIKTQRRFDPNIQRAQATQEMMDGKGTPREEPAVTRGRARGIAGGAAEAPDVLGLPRPLALKLSEEFGRTVHGILQAHCASCHNEHYAGQFQLRQVINRRDNTRETQNLNLEMTLPLIDPNNPSRSELLSSALRPHGLGKTKRPIFRSSNDLAYVKLARWVDNVCRTVKLETQRQVAAQGGQSQEEQFGSERPTDRNQVSFSSDASPELPVPAQPGRPNPRTARAMTSPPGIGPQNFPPADIPGESATSGVTMPRPDGSSRPGRPPVDPATQRANAAAEALPTLPGASPLQAADLASEDAPQPASGTKPTTTAKKPKKPVAIDPSLLERALRARNGGQ